jgi:hypothetical protein
MEYTDFYQEIALPVGNERLVRPFEHVEVPLDDNATIVSAITHESNSLFVPSMYPSLQGVRYDHDVLPQLKPLPVLFEKEEAQHEAQPSLQQSEAAFLKGVQGKDVSEKPRHENQRDVGKAEEPPELPMKATLNEDKFQGEDVSSNSADERASPPSAGSDAATQATALLPGAYEVAGAGHDPGVQNIGRQAALEIPLPARAALIDSEPAGVVAVATPVENDEDKPQQTAMPARETGHSARQISQKIFAWAFLGGIILMSGIAIGSICGSGLCTNNSAAQSSTQAPTTFRDIQAPDIQQNLEASLGSNYFADKSQSPNILAQRQKALEWIVHEDPLQLEPAADNLLQRFLLSCFYYLTTQQRPWKYCNPPNGTNGDICMFRFFFSPEVEVEGTSWLSGTSECEWVGVYCRKGLVEELLLRKFVLPLG